MVQYVAHHIANLSELTAPLPDLIKKDNEFSWTSSHDAAFKKIKSAVAEAATLCYFNPKHKTIIQVDASKHGLGAALIQIDPSQPNKERIVAFASKSLSDVEQRYANIERELLAVVFGIEKFHTYIYGASVTVESDHKPLESISLKDLSQAPARLQRMLLRIQSYDVEIKYRPGPEMQIADFLSRYRPREGKHIEMDHTIHAVRWSNDKMKALKEATTSDETLSDLKVVVQNGWPDKSSELPKHLQNFWSMRDYIGIEDGILTKGQQILIPETMHKDLLHQLHNHSHQGVKKTQLLARQCVYWPGIYGDIEKLVGSCDTCNAFQTKQQAEPMHLRDLPSGPWEMLASDIFECNGSKYLIVCDYYSKFHVVRKLNGETSSQVLKALAQIFSEHGLPLEVYTDNGPCYRSQEFATFAKEYNFIHTTSSPHYAQSNGFAERMVGTVKKTLLKCADTKTDPNLALLFLRTTPVASNLPSPAEMLYGRPIRSTLPSAFKFNMQHENTKRVLEQRQETQRTYYDAGKRQLPPLQPGDHVMLQSEKETKWQPATVVTPANEPRSFIVQDTLGKRYRRNRRFLRKLPEKETTAAGGETTNNTSPGTTQGTNKASKEPTPATRTSTRSAKKPDRLIEGK